MWDKAWRGRALLILAAGLCLAHWPVVGLGLAGFAAALAVWDWTERSNRDALEVMLWRMERRRYVEQWRERLARERAAEAQAGPAVEVREYTEGAS